MDTELNAVARALKALPETPDSTDYRTAAQALLPYIQHHVPALGEGQSLGRLRFLVWVGRHDLGLARLIEGHLDATQILREAGKPISAHCLYAIWASGGPSDTTTLERDTGPQLRLRGRKPFCSGSDIVDRALIHISADHQLLELDLNNARSQGGLRFEPGMWQAQAFAETHTWTLALDGLDVSAEQLVGERKWYFERPGFCLGALAPAACWAGGAFGLVDSVRQRKLKDGHARAHLGAMVATLCAMESLLRWGAEQADTDPGNLSGSLFPAALLVRHQIERGCTDVLDRFGRTLGPRPFVFEPGEARRIAELTIYIRQCHAERDLEELGDYLEQHPGFCAGPQLLG